MTSSFAASTVSTSWCTIATSCHVWSERLRVCVSPFSSPRIPRASPRGALAHPSGGSGSRAIPPSSDTLCPFCVSTFRVQCWCFRRFSPLLTPSLHPSGAFVPTRIASQRGTAALSLSYSCALLPRVSLCAHCTLPSSLSRPVPSVEPPPEEGTSVWVFSTLLKRFPRITSSSSKPSIAL